MRWFKKIVVSLLAIIVVAALLAIVTGNSHLFKAVATTYLVGKSGPSINEHHIFENREVKAAHYMPWKLSADYNKKENPQLLKEIEKYDPVAFLVIKDSELVYEKYWKNHDENSLTNSFSVAKTFVALLVGIAIDEGKIKSLDESVGNYLPEYNNHPELKIKHLLNMSSGINFDEDYKSPFGHMAKAYYGTDLYELNSDYQVTETPGKTWRYLGGNTLILSFVLEKATGKSIAEYMSEKIWQPIGAKNTALWNLDSENGREKAYCCFYSNARDFARIGQLLINKGKWNGQTIISEAFLKQAMNGAQGLKDANGKLVDFYGYQLWIAEYKNKKVYYARGILGQYIITIPEKRLVIVRLGNKRGENLPNYHPVDLYHYIDFALEQ
ncbi:MAG TPA: serine hydrolase [Vicingaceae bacterium]|nr:serine hydrolase [Vicingaceae bacterium]